MSLVGRYGHARVAVLTIIDEEMRAARDEFGANFQIPGTDYWVQQAVNGEGPYDVPVVIAQSSERTNMAAQTSAGDLLGHWRPEVLLLCGIAGGVRRAKPDASGEVQLEGPSLGDVVVGTYIHNAEYNKMISGGMRARYLPTTQPSLPLTQAHCRAIGRDTVWVSSELLDGRPGSSAPRVILGEVAAVDAVVGDPTNVHHTDILTRYDKALVVDMESAGVGWALHVYDTDVHYNPRWLCVRSISDEVADNKATAELLNVDAHQIRDLWREPAARTAAAFAHAVVASLLATDRKPLPARPGAPAYRRPAAPSVGEDG